MTKDVLLADIPETSAVKVHIFQEITLTQFTCFRKTEKKFPFFKLRLYLFVISLVIKFANMHPEDLLLGEYGYHGVPEERIINL